MTSSDLDDGLGKQIAARRVPEVTDDRRHRLRKSTPEDRASKPLRRPRLEDGSAFVLGMATLLCGSEGEKHGCMYIP